MWFLYILECSDNSYYTGITKNLDKRLTCHNKGLGSKYTRARLPCKFVATSEISDSMSDALKIERRFKKLNRNDKKKEILRGLHNFVQFHLSLMASLPILI